MDRVVRTFVPVSVRPRNERGMAVGDGTVSRLGPLAARFSLGRLGDTEPESGTPRRASLTLMVWEPEVLHADGPYGRIPATLFVSRDVNAGAPLILLGHGAHTSKDDPTMQVLARALARGVGAGVATLDCPGHGERRPAGLDEAGFDTLVQANMTDPAVFDQLVTEWPLVAAAARGSKSTAQRHDCLRRILDGEHLRLRDRSPSR